jgi:hypothetical protein
MCAGRGHYHENETEIVDSEHFLDRRGDTVRATAHLKDCNTTLEMSIAKTGNKWRPKDRNIEM